MRPLLGEIEHRDLLGHPHRVVQREQQRRDVDHRRARAPDDGARHGEGRGQVAVVDAVVLGEHDRGEVAVVGPGRHLEAGRVLLGGRGRRDVGNAQVEAHGEDGTSHWHTPHENGLQFADIVSETVSPYRLLIGGDWVEGGSGSYGVVNPATEDVVDEAPEASADDAREAAAAARAAFPAWSRTSPQERAALLQAVADRVRERAEELLPLIIAETGATLSVGSALQVPMCANRFERYATGALKDLTIAIPPMEMQSTPLAAGGLMGAVGLRPPVGVVACITPYNFPITSMAGKVGTCPRHRQHGGDQARAPGPLAVIELVRIIQDVGVPAGRRQPRDRVAARSRARPSSTRPTSTWSASPAAPRWAPRSRGGRRGR